MKKANYALFQSRGWISILGKLAWAMVFAWCCLGVQEVSAQDDFVIAFDAKDNDNTCTKVKLEDCGGTVDNGDVKFTDDGFNDGNYADSRQRIDTVEICPKDAGSRVRIVFTDFDLAQGDILNYYEGTKAEIRTTETEISYLRDAFGNFIWDTPTFDANGCVNGSIPDGLGRPGIDPRRRGPVAKAIPPSGTGTGVGVYNAFGGWIDASCDLSMNASGCLTFILRTNGDNIKGAGWEAWVDCQDRDIEVIPPNIPDQYLECDELSATVYLGPPTVKSCGENIGIDPGSNFDKAFIRVFDAEHKLIFDSHVGTGIQRVTWFTVGQYFVEYKLKVDTTITAETIFSVQSRPLVANDNVSIPLGEGCAVQLVPDDVLEGTCPPIKAFMHYEMTISIGSGKDEVVRKSVVTHDAANDTILVEYPMITEADILAAGLSICDASAKVTVERVYFEFGDPLPEYDPSRFASSVTTTVNLSDISRPVINAPANGAITIIGCDTTGLAKALGAVATDNCDDAITVDYSVSDIKDPCLVTQDITVTMTATDDCGNSSTISRTYTLQRPTLDMFVRPDGVVAECADEITIPVPGVQVSYIKNGTRTVVDTVDLSEEYYVCGYGLVHEDVAIPNTDCGSKLYRYYDVIDWCDPANSSVFKDTVFIQTTDKGAPVIQGEDEDKVTPTAEIELGDNECTYDITQFGGPNATDDCSEVSVRIGAVYRVEDGADWPIDPGLWSALDCDSFKLQWIAEDACHEQLVNDTSFQIVLVQDVSVPSAVCIDEIIVSVPGDEGARVEVGQIDGGSRDNCEIVSREIKIQGRGDWADHVIIECDDVHEELVIEMRVTDKNGNFNICWLDVVVEDKIPPVCEDLGDRTISCKDIHTGELGASTDADDDGQMEDTEWQPLTGDLLDTYNTHFGTPSCEDNVSCGTLIYEHEYQLIEDDCGALRARRRYRASDWKPLSSTWAEQLITVSYTPDWIIDLPADKEYTCSDPEIGPASTAEQIIDNGSCDLWALEVTADTFVVPGDVCLKIERTYELINWCIYNADDPAMVISNDPEGKIINSEDYGSIGRFTYTQVIRLYTTEAPNVVINDVNTCIVGVNDALPYGEEDVTPNAAAFECDTIRTFSATATNCVGAYLTDFEWKFYVDGALADSGTGSSFDKIVSPKIKYKVEFWASDGCGNSAGESKEFEFWDCKKPTPYLINGLAIELGEDGTVDFWATDLDRGSFDNCTDQSDLIFKIAIGTPTIETLDEVLALPSVVTLTCNNVGNQTVSIYVIDEENNWDFARSTVDVQSILFDCSSDPTGTGMVAGHIVNPNGEDVEQVSVSVSGAMQESMTTGANGEFQFSLNSGGAYTVTPVKDMNPLNGVSTFDLVLISKHILGITTFDSPYKYIAADVNKSGTVTAFDMVQLRQLILSITTDFANNDSWRFVDAKHDFAASNENPLAQTFGEFMDISSLATNMMDVDFIGVKVGDVNGNASANSLLSAETRSTNGTLNFDVEDRFVQVGETVAVDFKSIDINLTQGYQFTMNFAGLNFDKLGEGVAKAANFNTKLAERGIIATSWNGEATTDDVLFTLHFTATADGLLSDLISVSSDITLAEAYNTDGELLDINFKFSSTAAAAGFELAQNTPNPFNGETVIGFSLPKAGFAKLTVMNIQGKVLTEIKGDYAKGYNSIVLKASDLGATGVLHYQLESAEQVATKKMIIIE